MRVLLVCDLEDWILGEIARHLARLLADRMQVTVIVSHANGFRSAFDDLQRSHDVVHFLSPWDLFAWSNRTWLPCVVTLWHILDWGAFDAYVSRIDALYVGS